MKKKLTWIAAGALIAVAIAIFSVWLPAPLKKLGLFSCLLGGVIGFALWKLREKFDLKNHTSDKWVAFVSGGLAEAVRISESYRIHLAEQQRRLTEEIEKLPGMFPTLKSELTERVKQNFTDFLSLRYSALSNSLEQHTGSWVLLTMFAFELLLACGAAFLVYRYLFQQANQTISDESSQK